MRSEPAEPDGNFRSGPSLRHANVVILTDETEFARLLTACWQTERQAPGVTVLNSDSWQDQDAPAHDLIVVGPIHDGKLTSVLRSLDPSTAVILCAPADTREFGQLRMTAVDGSRDRNTLVSFPS